MRWAREEPPPPAIGGVIVASVTPRRAGEWGVDVGAMLEIVDFAGANGADSIALFGAAGEFIHFTPKERSRSIALAAKRSRIPVIANVSHSTLDAAVTMAEEAAGDGSAAVMVMPPYFYAYPAETVEAFCFEFAAQAARWIRVILCDLPSPANPISDDAARRLLETGLFAGIVDAGGSAERLQQRLRMAAASGAPVLMGSDRDFVTARKAGACGIVSETAAAIPELIVSLDRALKAGASDAVDRLEAHLKEFLDAASLLPPLVAIREACSLRGFQIGPHAAPLGDAFTRRCDEFRAWFHDWLPFVQKECSGVPV